MAGLTTAQQKRQDTQNILNQYVAAERFLTGQFGLTENSWWLEQSLIARQRIQELKAELAQEAT